MDLIMTAKSARIITNISLEALSGLGGNIHRAITRSAHMGFSNVLIDYTPKSGLWDKAEWDSLTSEGYRVELFPIQDDSHTFAVVSW